MKLGWTFITVQPIDFADEIAKFKFSILWYVFVGFRFIA